MTRGQRNCNPLNIRRGRSRWYGLKPETECRDTEFCEFSDMLWGVRAALKLLQNYINEGGCRTLKDIVYRWAPPSENISSVYLTYVSRRTSVAPGRLIEADDMDRLIAIVRAMSAYESGLELDYEFCRSAWDLL